MRRTISHVLAVALFATPTACGDDDGQGNGTMGKDGGSRGTEDAALPDSLPLVPVLDAGFVPGDAGAACSAAVGVQCDGPEDCPASQVCCGTYDQATFGYTSVECADSCDDTGNQRELCHPGDPCDNEEFVCRASQLLPFSFLAVCSAPSSMVGDATGSEIEGEVVCGEDTCVVGEEHCCLRSGFDLANRMRIRLDPLCLPLATACECDAEYEPTPADAGHDAGAHDAGHDAGHGDELDGGDDDGDAG